MEHLFKGKRILVTGGTGSIGSGMVRQLLQYGPEVVRIYSRDETKQFYLQDELRGHENVRFLIGDVRDKDRMAVGMEGIDIVFHAAALKHVPACEYNPFEAVETNVRGMQNVIQAAIQNNVQKVVAISTDKAVNPISVMGATKLLVERLVTSAQFSKGSHITTFACVRFGNVIGSRGSVLNLFREQIRRGGPVTVTAPEMTRFFMRLSEAVELVFRATALMQGGDLFILKMPAVRLGELVRVVVDELAPRYGRASQGIEIQEIGLRPGEKVDEELMTIEESRHAQETERMFIVVPPIMNPYAPYEAYTYLGARKAPGCPYLSCEQEPMATEEVRSMLRDFLSETEWHWGWEKG